MVDWIKWYASDEMEHYTEWEGSNYLKLDEATATYW